MAQRSALQSLLVTILGNTNVYFQPPPSLAMKYPCIVYKLDDLSTTYADNRPYNHMKRYQITHIDVDPDSTIPDFIRDLPFCSFDRAYPANNVNHQIFNIYF